MTARGTAYPIGPIDPQLHTAASLTSQYAATKHSMGAAYAFLNSVPVAQTPPLPSTLQIYPQINNYGTT